MTTIIYENEMKPLELIIAPNPIFKKKAAVVTDFDDVLAKLVEAMFDVLYHHQGVGLGANMVGVLKRIVIIDLNENGNNLPMVFINPKITETSSEQQVFTEASLSFPEIYAEISRPKAIKVCFQNLKGEDKTFSAEGWLATVIQHEMDYLDGRTFLDHLSPIKRNNLLRKMKKKRAKQA